MDDASKTSKRPPSHSSAAHWSRKGFLPLALACFGLSLFCAPAQAKKKHPLPPEQSDNATPAPEPEGLPAEAGPRVNPEDPPSVSLGRFVDMHLGKILAPLGDKAFAQPEVIADLQATYAAGMTTAPANHRAAYLAAIAVCGALTGVISERQDAVTNLRGALATRSSESQQPRGGGEAVARAKAGDAFFLSSQKSNWITRATALRQNIAALYLRERQTEAQIGLWNPPAPSPAPTVPGAEAAVMPAPAAAPTPSVSVPVPAAVASVEYISDPIIGNWRWDSYLDVTLNADHSISSKRQGTWLLAPTEDGKRHYEFHYNSRADWIDSLTLSDDGRTLEGTNKYGKFVSARRK